MSEPMEHVADSTLMDAIETLARYRKMEEEAHALVERARADVEFLAPFDCRIVDVDGTLLATRSTTISKRVDLALLRKRYQEIANECTVESESTRITLGRRR